MFWFLCLSPPGAIVKGVNVSIGTTLSGEPLTGFIMDNGKVIDLETGEVIENPSWQQRADALRSKRILDGKFVTSRMAKPNGKRMRGDECDPNALADSELLYDETVDDYEWPEVFIPDEAERVKAFRGKMGWDAPDSKMVPVSSPGPRKPSLTKARERDGVELIRGITFHYLNHEIAYGVNTKGEAVSYNFRTGKLLFTPSVNRAKKILAALETRGAARVSRQTGIPVDVLQNWKKQGHCGGVLCVTALGVNVCERGAPKGLRGLPSVGHMVTMSETPFALTGITAYLTC